MLTPLKCERDADTMATKKQYTWQITLIRERGKLLGHVEAPDEKSAIEEAIKAFQITNPEQQKRLIARRET
jgi:hypothetical protein